MTWLFPFAAAVVAGVFAGMLTRRWLRTRQTFEWLWAKAMAMYALASLCLALGAAAGWNDLLFRGYWLFGAILTVPFLAAGEGALLFRSTGARRSIVGALVVLTLVAVAVVLFTPIQPEAYTQDLPRGALAYEGHPLPLAITRVYAYASYALLVAGALWSAWRMRAKPELRGRFVGTLLIALGASVVAGGSAFAAQGALTGFSLTLLGGICVMFAGFLAATRSTTRAPVPSQPESAPVR